jgi:uroporphyrinogen-III synthase
MGALIDAPVTYRNILPHDAAPRLRAYTESGAKPNWILFTSPSTVKNFLEIGGREIMGAAKTASIGPTTSQSLAKNGLSADVEPAIPSLDAMIDAILAASRQTTR